MSYDFELKLTGEGGLRHASIAIYPNVCLKPDQQVIKIDSSMLKKDIDVNRTSVFISFYPEGTRNSHLMEFRFVIELAHLWRGYIEYDSIYTNLIAGPAVPSYVYIIPNFRHLQLGKRMENDILVAVEWRYPPGYYNFSFYTQEVP